MTARNWFESKSFDTSATNLPPNGASLDFSITLADAASAGRLVIAPRDESRFYGVEIVLDAPKFIGSTRRFSFIRRVIDSDNVLASCQSEGPKGLFQRDGQTENKLRLTMRFTESNVVEIELRPRDTSTLQLRASFPIDSVFEDIRLKGFDVHFASRDVTSIDQMFASDNKHDASLIWCLEGFYPPERSTFSQQENEGVETISRSIALLPQLSEHEAAHQRALQQAQMQNVLWQQQQQQTVIPNGTTSSTWSSSTTSTVCNNNKDSQQQPNVVFTAEHFAGLPNGYPNTNTTTERSFAGFTEAHFEGLPSGYPAGNLEFSSQQQQQNTATVGFTQQHFEGLPSAYPASNLALNSSSSAQQQQNNTSSFSEEHFAGLPASYPANNLAYSPVSLGSPESTDTHEGIVIDQFQPIVSGTVVAEPENKTTKEDPVLPQ